MQHRLTVSILCAGLLLVACGGEPSDANLLEALKKQTDAANNAAAAVGGQRAAQMMKTTVHGVKKIACKQAGGKSGYQCDFEMDVEAPFAGRTKQSGSARFVKGDNGWQMFGQ